MFDLSSKLFRNSILVAVMATGVSTVVAAQDAVSATGLGQAWPNAPDVSSNAHYHVYRFERDGITYIQINDLQGRVRAAVATAKEVTFALPIGVDAQNVAVKTVPSPTDLTQVVYQDDGLTVTAAPQDDGSENVMVVVACDPAQCTMNRVAQ
ncbi:MAG TPA: hypothetical protein VMA74_11240 [Dyella sp.]|uniref:hypothetical protein n=1 Tax=Dyella sp. TaxID=1869338 RepID=UPI002BB059A9|nr:hypothetical protein [Dyella sp.]HUB90286.1 hypothetical protein [Dyella sp.]